MSFRPIPRWRLVPHQDAGASASRPPRFRALNQNCSCKPLSKSTVPVANVAPHNGLSAIGTALVGTASGGCHDGPSRNLHPKRQALTCPAPQGARRHPAERLDPRVNRHCAWGGAHRWPAGDVQVSDFLRPHKLRARPPFCARSRARPHAAPVSRTRPRSAEEGTAYRDCWSVGRQCSLTRGRAAANGVEDRFWMYPCDTHLVVAPRCYPPCRKCRFWARCKVSVRRSGPDHCRQEDRSQSWEARTTRTRRRLRAR
jgi:hypothetical protein